MHIYRSTCSCTFFPLSHPSSRAKKHQALPRRKKGKKEKMKVHFWGFVFRKKRNPLGHQCVIATATLLLLNLSLSNLSNKETSVRFQVQVCASVALSFFKNRSKSSMLKFLLSLSEPHNITYLFLQGSMHRIKMRR